MDTKSIEIGLWLLARTGSAFPDELVACAVAAKDEATARQMANQAALAEGYVWTNNEDVSATYLGVASDGVAGVLLTSLEAPPKRPTENQLSKDGIWLLTRTETPYADEWGACMVAADDEDDAREMANQVSLADGYVWTDGHRVNARCVGTASAGTFGILLHSMEVPE